MMNTHHIFGGQHFSSFLDVSISLSFYRYSCVSSWHVTSQHRQNSRFCATHRTNYFSLSECVKLGSIFFFFFHFYSKFSLLLGRVHSVVCVCVYICWAVPVRCYFSSTVGSTSIDVLWKVFRIKRPNTRLAQWVTYVSKYIYKFHMVSVVSVIFGLFVVHNIHLKMCCSDHILFPFGIQT